MRRAVIIEVIVAATIILFVYAAMSKLLAYPLVYGAIRDASFAEALCRMAGIGSTRNGITYFRFTGDSLHSSDGLIRLRYPAFHVYGLSNRDDTYR